MSTPKGVARAVQHRIGAPERASSYGDVRVYRADGTLKRVIPAAALRGRADPVPAQHNPTLGPREVEHALVPQSPKAWRRATTNRKRTAG